LKQGSSYLVTYLKTMLGSNYHVFAPEMPEPEHPDYNHWRNELDKDLALLRDNAILIGHSLGGSVLLKYLSEQPVRKPIAGLFIVGAPFWGLDHWEVDEYRLMDNFQHLLPPMSRLVLYHSRNDEVVPFSHVNMYASKLPWATIRETRGSHLFHKGLPELVADIKTIPRSELRNPLPSKLHSTHATTTLNPYLHFAGQCREAMNFYRDCLGGDLTLHPVKGSAIEGQYDTAVHHHIAQATLIKDGLILFAADTSGPEGIHRGNSVALCLNCNSEEEINRYFTKLSKGAQITVNLRRQYASGKFGALIDKYGVSWMLNYSPTSHP